MEPDNLIRSGIAASAVAHLSLLGMILFLGDIRMFSTVTAEPMTVDLVTPDEVPPSMPEIPKDEPPKQSDNFDLSMAALTQPPAAAETPAPPPEPPAQKAAAAPTPEPAKPPQPAPAHAGQPQSPPPTPVAQPASPPAPPQAEPDITVKYAVALGLPGGGDFDSAAYTPADIASSEIAAFRRHLKTCAPLPAAISPTDKVKIVLRVSFTPDGRLAAAPNLIEASASQKGPALMRGAISALTACQPYTMLSPDKYREWKILDLNFTPQDFVGG